MFKVGELNIKISEELRAYLCSLYNVVVQLQNQLDVNDLRYDVLFETLKTIVLMTEECKKMQMLKNY